jgi:phenylalanyl-tRNA synthetase beta chain
VAREYSHATGAVFRDPTGNANPELFNGYPLNIDDQAPLRGKPGVGRFILRQVSNVDVSRPTPPWMAARLKMAGMRSISLVVDITNYVMLELGQPLHAYDLDTLVGGITVRRAKSGETIKTLDGQSRKLHAEDLLITDDEGAIGIAGVMGGERTEVTGATKNVLIEAANFDPVSIARSARRHKLPSEASKRFERGVDHSVAKFALARAVQLLEVHAHGNGESIGSDYRGYAPTEPIWLPADYAQRLTGVEYEYERQAEILREVGCLVATVNDGFEVTPPTWRPDLGHKADLVEEIARIAGYDLIPARLPVAPPGRGLTRAQSGRRLVANTLAAAGLTEVLNYPFIGDEANHWFDDAKQPTVTLSNPIQSEAAQMRLGLLPNLLDAAKRNLGRGLVNLALFEIGSVFRPTKAANPKVAMPSVAGRPSDTELKALKETIPAQPKHIAAVFIGESIPQQVGQRSTEAGYQDAVQAVRLLAHSIGLAIDLEQAEPKGYHPGRSAQVFAVSADARVSLGFVGELDPSLAAANDLPRRVGVLELDLDAMLAAAPETLKAGPIYVMTAATQMLSLEVNVSVAAEAVRQTIIRGAGELLEAAELVDDYRGENLAADKKSLTFALRFRAEDRTLTQVEASEARDAAVALAEKEFGASIRK